MAQKTIDFDNDILRPIGSLKEDLADLKDNKITKFYTNNNGDTTLNDSDDGKIQDLMIYGKSEQKQYKGTNLLGAVTKHEQTVFGVTATPQVDGSFLLNGTTTKDTVDIYLAGTWGTTIVGTLDPTKKYFFRGSGNSKIGIKVGTQKNMKFVGEAGSVINGFDYAFYYLQIATRETTLNNVVVYPQINEGTTLLEYEPYTGGKPSPNPEYPQEIKAVVNPVIKTHGKNLYDSKKYPLILNRAINSSTGEIYATVQNTGKYYAVEKYIPFPYGGKKISFNNSMTLCAYDKDYKIISNIKQNERTIPLETMYVRFDIEAQYKDVAQIELSENKTSYEPYQETQATLPYELNAIPVSSGGNVTIDGQQYIADYVDVERGKLVRMTELIEYDGTENWSLQSINNNGIANFQIIVTRSIGSIGMCDTLQLQKTIISNTNTEGFMINHNNILFIRINTTRGISTLETFKEFLANKHIFILYALSTPTEIDLVKEEITAFKALSTYYPKTYVDAESEQLEAYTMFSYPVSMEKGWEYVKQQIGDTRKYVYDMDLQSAEAYVNSEYAVALTELEV